MWKFINIGLEIVIIVKYVIIYLLVKDYNLINFYFLLK